MRIVSSQLGACLLCLAPTPRSAPAAMVFPFQSKSTPNIGMPLLGNTAPAWDALQEQALATPTGERMAAERDEWAAGDGPAHTDAKLRLFGKSDVRVVLYRDMAAWCPYCQKARARAPPHLSSLRALYTHRALCPCAPPFLDRRRGRA